MELMCPHCHSNNPVGPEVTSEAARFTCTSCGTQFDAVLVEGALVTVMPREGRVPLEPAPAEDYLDILSIPQDPLDPAPGPSAPHSQVLEDVFTAPAPAAEEVDPLHLTEEIAERVAQASAPVSATARAVRAAAAPHAAEPAPAKTAAQGKSYDKYAVGMRVLRVSPMWLLLSSAGFFAVLLTMSWLSSPAVPVGEAVASGPKMRNQATNPAPTSPAAAQVEQVMAAAEKALPAAPPQQAAAKPPQPEAAPAAPTPAGKAPAPAAKEPAPAPPTPAGSGNYTVQIGSFNHASEANQHVSKLRAAGFEAHAVAVELPGRGTWHRVQAGRFETREEAARAGAQLRTKGLAAAAMVTEFGKK